MWHLETLHSASLDSAGVMIWPDDPRGLFLNDSVVSETLGLAVLLSRPLALILLEAEAHTFFPQANKGWEVVELFNYRDWKQIVLSDLCHRAGSWGRWGHCSWIVQLQCGASWCLVCSDGWKHLFFFFLIFLVMFHWTLKLEASSLSCCKFKEDLPRVTDSQVKWC